jgi:esterase/lipase
MCEVFLVGFSLGCYPTAKVASLHRVKGLVLLSPMMSLISLMQE